MSTSGGTVTAAASILASHVYAPAGNTTYAATTAVAPIDTANATLAFTVPANGIVDVEVDFFYYTSDNSPTGGTLTVALLNHTGGAQVGLSQPPINVDVSSQDWAFPYHGVFHLAGLTPGALQLDVAVGKAAVTSSNFTLEFQGPTGLLSYANGGPLTIRAFTPL